MQSVSFLLFVARFMFCHCQMEWQKYTPVMLAASRGHSNVVRVLLGEKADLTILNVSFKNILFHNLSEKSFSSL